MTNTTNQDLSLCDITSETNVHDTAYRLSDIAFLFVGPIVIQLVIYGIVVCRLWRHSAATRGSVLATRRNRQLAKLCIALLSVFGVCCGPYFVVDIVVDRIVDHVVFNFSADVRRRAEAASDTARKTFVMLAFAYSWITPLVYTMLNEKVRAHTIQLLHRCCCFGCGNIGSGGNRVQPVMIVANVQVDENIIELNAL